MKRYILFAALSLLLASCAKEESDSFIPQPTEGVTLSVQCVDMLPQVIMSRAVESKTAEEKKINRLHLFFFDKEGNFLIPTSDNFKPYHVANIGENGLAAVTIPKNAFQEQQDLTDIQIYAVANPISNVQDADHTNETFRVETYSPNGTICHGDANDPAKEVTITNLDDLRNWYYRPAKRADVTKLPAGGMPMVAHYQAPAGKKVLADNGTIVLQMKALMARVDIKVNLDANQTSHDHRLPTLQVEQYGIKNMPRCVPFTAPTTTTTVPTEDIEPEMLVKLDNPMTLVDGQQTEVFTYYTYENIKEKKAEPKYPAGVDVNDETVTQRWKPTIAPDDASAFIMKGHYVTHQGLEYDASFTVYLGSDVVDKFDVRRNHCYKNNITICGLDYVRNSDESKYTFDGRVNVITENPVYISIVNERKVDAHATALPMDIYFLRMENNTAICPSTVTIELLPENDGRIPDWIRMEKVSAATMKANDYKAGTGAREYFTTDLVTNTLKDNTKYVIHNNYDNQHPEDGTRTRIYFYIDENVPASNNPAPGTYGDRTAVVRVHYENEEGEDRNRTIEIDQKALLHVTGERNSLNIDYWLEYYEEYMDHKDPLDLHSMPAELYSGLPWSKRADGNDSYATNDDFRSYLGNIGISIFNRFDSYEVYGAKQGLWMTEFMLLSRTGRRPITDVKIYNDEIPPTAFHYCYGKNKRLDDGNVPTPTNGQGYWFLPGISDLEIALETYYTTFPEFQQNLYWSASSASYKRLLITYEYESHARATAIKPDGKYIESGTENPDYDANDPMKSGKAPRTTPLRIRAGYVFR